MCYKCIVLHALLKVLFSRIELYMHDSALHAPEVHLTFLFYVLQAHIIYYMH